MEAAASAITVIVFSLQSTKFVYQAVDDIRDGPSVIAALAGSTKRLEGILQQLKELIDNTSQSQQPSNPARWQALQQKISECSKDMQEASQQLQVLSPNNATQKVGKAWKRVKLSLKEKFFTRLDDRIKGHLAELGLQLQIVSRDARQLQQHTTSETSMRDAKNEISLMSNTLVDRTTENTQEIKLLLASMVTSLAKDADVANGKRVEDSRSLHQSLQENTDTVANRLQQSEQNTQQHIHHGNEQIAARLDRSEAMSTDQCQTILGLLHQILGRGKTEASGATLGDNRSGINNPLDIVNCEDQGKGLSAAIDRLGRFASNTTTIYDSDEAEEIIDDLEHIINALLKYDGENADPTQSNRKRKRCSDDSDPDVQREMKKVRGLLTASRAIEIAGSTAARKDRNSSDQYKKLRRSMKVYEIDDYTAMVSIRSGIDGTSMLIPGTRAAPLRNANGFFEARISILPRKSTQATKISAFFTQRLTQSGFSSAHPGLSFHPMIHDDADIFGAVKAGHVDRMLELFETGKASLHDCDRKGRSLLNVCK
ncbi:MAG: hypothetical protein Q9169_005669 [Polycauliona sp. 2 TL-2023]